MRMIIKGADFSNVSIGKVERDLSFVLSGNKPVGITFPNWDATNEVVSPTIDPYMIKEIDGNTVVALRGGQENVQRLRSDYIEVEEGMKVSAMAMVINGTTNIYPWIVCFNENKTLLTDPETYAVYYEGTATSSQKVEFTIPSGVKYIKIQAGVYTQQAYPTYNIFTGSMP